MKITQTIKFIFYPLFLKKAIEHKMTVQEMQTLLPYFVHRKIHLICEGNERIKRECYQEIEEIFLNDNLEY